MRVAELRFTVIGNTDYAQAERAIRAYLEALIFTGQILGREFPTAFIQDQFVCRVVMPSDDALAKQFHSKRGLAALEALASAGLSYPQLQILGSDLMSNHTDPCPAPQQLILYCRFSLNNSVLYCAEHFAPVPLYQLAPGQDFEKLIRWQLQYQALDEVQMQEDSVLQGRAELALQSPHSVLNREGRQWAKSLSKQLAIPVIYALYRGTSTDCVKETARLCPYCQSAWRLGEPWHDLFDFYCRQCRVVSNIAWQCQD